MTFPTGCIFLDEFYLSCERRHVTIFSRSSKHSYNDSTSDIPTWIIWGFWVFITEDLLLNIEFNYSINVLRYVAISNIGSCYFNAESSLHWRLWYSIHLLSISTDHGAKNLRSSNGNRWSFRRASFSVSQSNYFVLI